ncbi:NUDIX hydrolase [Robertkochia marina]|uniref:NUDIX hydrolase n=1 Tax=Robertkochia marina TaxID=1227945 RepID=A0A4S3LZS8_9FLAO|nr:NUDIX domain-containing protein [Robertkochia marina]THD67614.1 NUDIX hydrolase [Robertkochia marina]TRZ43346.1 NUDIX hydrolase [Robertkochia marina]
MQDIKVAVDAVVFGYKEETLFLLCIKQKFGPMADSWVLPGGLVQDDEPLKDAVKRELREETNVELEYMDQLYTFGDDIKRDPRGRVIAVAYLGLVDPKRLELKADTDALDAQWFPIDALPSLGYDHELIFEKGLERLRAKIHYEPIGFDLLEEEFFFSEMEGLYRTITGRAFDRRNFRKKILSFGFLEDLGTFRREGMGRPANKFRFIEDKYNELLAEGFHFELKFA